MKILSLFSLLLCALAVVSARAGAAEPTETRDLALLANLKPTHPRLLVGDQTWAQLRARRATDAELDAFLKRQELEARALLNVEPIAYQKTGRRLLAVSRTVLRRVLLLSMQYQLTGDQKLLSRSQSEMLNAANYKDWNPSHFLDTAEMTAALAIGYDWLYADLDATARQTIATAIREKGLQAGLQSNGWVKSTNNWNSVCHAGMVMGALALADDDPQMAAHYVGQAVEFNPRVLHSYAPDGIYPEGLGYWTYGTTFQVMLVESLRSALGHDWDLGASAGFLPSARALFSLVGPSGSAFNYSDGGERANFDGTTMWFARELQQPAIAQLENDLLRSYAQRAPNPTSHKERTLPLAALWWPANKNAPRDLPLSWIGAGSNPIAAFRSSWDDTAAMWLALKGGRASNSHGHMDAGSFVFESDGVRWARDLGSQSYESLESKGVALWDKAQQGERWRIFRLGPLSHNTLTINGQLHDAHAHAPIARFGAGENAGAVVDLSAVFKEQAKRVTRGFLFRAGQDVTIRDELQGLKTGDVARFALVTRAQIAISADGQSATLTAQGQKLTAKLAATNGKWEVIDARGAQSYDAENPDTRILIANFSAPASGALSWTVTLTPGSAKVADANRLAQMAIEKWPLAKAQ